MIQLVLHSRVLQPNVVSNTFKRFSEIYNCRINVMSKPQLPEILIDGMVLQQKSTVIKYGENRIVFKR